MQYATHDDVHKAFRIRAYAACGFPHPDHVDHDPEMVKFFNDQAVARHELPHVIISPPAAGNCAHCGAETLADQHVRAHAVAGAEDLVHPETGEPLRMLVSHCGACHESAACDPNTPTPGSGHTTTPGGFCEPHQEG